MSNLKELSEKAYKMYQTMEGNKTLSIRSKLNLMDPLKKLVDDKDSKENDIANAIIELQKTNLGTNKLFNIVNILNQCAQFHLNETTTEKAENIILEKGKAYGSGYSYLFVFSGDPFIKEYVEFADHALKFINSSKTVFPKPEEQKTEQATITPEKPALAATPAATPATATTESKAPETKKNADTQTEMPPKAHQRDIESLQDEITRLAGEVAGSIRENKELKEYAKSKDNTNMLHRVNIEELNKKLVKKDKENDRLREELKQARQETSQKLTLFEKQVDTVKKELEQTRNENANLKKILAEEKAKNVKPLFADVVKTTKTPIPQIPAPPNTSTRSLRDPVYKAKRTPPLPINDNIDIVIEPRHPI